MANKAPVVYFIDTSALIDLRLYPRNVFGGLWRDVEELIARGRLIAPREVLRELRRKDDDMYRWANGHQEMFVDLDGEQMELVRQIQETFPKLVDHDADSPEADPFVIALAKCQTLLEVGVARIVVSHEIRGGRGASRIPNVCEHYRIEHVNLVGLFIREGWSY